MFGKEITAGI